MDRTTFFKCFAAGAAGMAAAGGSAAGSPEAKTAPAGRRLGSPLYIQDTATSGVRRLGKDKSFTFWTPGMEPAYRVGAGEVVVMELSHGLPDSVTRDGTFRRTGENDRINPQTGPVFIEGIGPGDGLALDILEVRVADWGYSGGKIYELADGFVHFDDRLRLPLSPMIGGVGVAPAEGRVDTRTPGATGGNLDCKEVRAGSTLVLTARVAGGLVGMGDSHALQGDGEIAGQGIECDAEVLVRFRRLPEKLSERPVILRPEFVATLSAKEDLNEAAWEATNDMTALVSRITGRDAKTARQLVNLVGDLRVTQIVDPTKGARMEVPAWVFGI
ncbi:MAG: acetamidase/formamidase family protein [Candidatus Glassbacteria bacterium]